jgi:type II secretory pathway pseudopilin PulG
MGLLGAGADNPKFSSIDDFLRSDDAMGLAIGLLSNNDSFAHGFGAGLNNMTGMGDRALNNQLKKLQMMDMMSQIQQRQQQAAAGRQIAQMYGLLEGGEGGQPVQPTAVAPSGAQPGSMMMQGGSLNPSPQSPPQPQQAAATKGGSDPGAAIRTKMAQMLILSGHPEKAIGLLDDGGYGQPQNAIDENGNPVLIQTNKFGNIRQVPGYKPVATEQQKSLARADAEALKESRKAATSARTMEDALNDAEKIVDDTSDMLLGPIVGADIPVIGRLNTKVSGNAQRIESISGLLTSLARQMLEFPASGFSEGDREMLTKMAVSPAYDKGVLKDNIARMRKLAKRVQGTSAGYEQDFAERGRISSGANGQQQTAMRRYNPSTGRIE